MSERGLPPTIEEMITEVPSVCLPPIVVHPTMSEDAIGMLEQYFGCPVLRSAFLPEPPEAKE